MERSIIFLIKSHIDFKSMPQKITRREFIRRADGAAARLPFGKI
jgi:hypothetical protein